MIIALILLLLVSMALAITLLIVLRFYIRNMMHASELVESRQQKSIDQLQKFLQEVLESSRQERTELLNRLASVNWGQISVPTSTSLTEMPTEVELEGDPEIFDYLDLNEPQEWAKMGLTNPALVLDGEV